MLKAVGYIILVAGGIGFIYFKTYNGKAISSPFIWLFVSTLTALIGGLIVMFSENKKSTRQDKFNAERLEKLKRSAERILISIDNCEIRENNYYEEVVNRFPTGIESADAIYEPNRNYHQRHASQSVIIYFYKENGQKIRMVSEPYPYNSRIIKNWIEMNKVTLYINRLNKIEYCFDISA